MVRMFHSFNISNKLNRLNNTAFMIAMVIITFQNSSHKNKMKFYTNETLYDITELLKILLQEKNIAPVSDLQRSF